MWVPKSWSFVKLHKVGNFPTWVISIFNGLGFFSEAVNFSPKFLGLSVGILGTVFEQFGLNFWDSFRTIRTRF